MSVTAKRLLLVEDNPADARFIRELLSESNESLFQVAWATSLADALQQLEHQRPDLVILDLTLPDSSGFETFERLHHQAPELPIVVVSGLNEEQTAIRAVQEGAQDYLVKDQFSFHLLVRSLRYAIERNRMRQSLRDSEARFRQLTENMRDVFWLFDVRAQQLIYLSPSFEQVWGRDSKSLFESSKTLGETIHPDDRRRVTGAFREKAVRGEFSEEYRIVRPDGSVRWIWDRAVPIADSAGIVYRIAGIAEDITERRELEREVLEISTRLQQQISSDLHDSVGQSLVGLSYIAKSLSHKLAHKNLSESKLADEIVATTHRAISEVRNAIRGLTPVEVDGRGLMVALEQLVRCTQERFDIPCRLAYDQPVLVENNATATHLFRIAQEAITNSVKHAAPSAISVCLESGDNYFSLKVIDDGVGLAQPREVTAGFGLRIMRYRAAAIGATFEVQSSSGSGTTISCTLEPTNPNGQKSNKPTDIKTVPDHDRR